MILIVNKCIYVFVQSQKSNYRDLNKVLNKESQIIIALYAWNKADS